MLGPWQEDEIIHRGAEAVVHSGCWMGREAVLKIREPRTWRHPELDARLTKSRLSAEARLLNRLYREGLPVPELLAIDATIGWMILSRCPGLPLFEVLRGSGEATMLEDVGMLIQRMHSAGITHGDLTTHNILWDDDEGLSLIDLGLSAITDELETMGLDLQVLHECLKASHPDIQDGIERVIVGYLQHGDDGAQSVVDRFNAIRGRVRYHG